MSLLRLADSLLEAVNQGNVDSVMDLLKRGANVNIIPSSGRTALGKASQLNHIGIVNLILDAESFYKTPEEESIDINKEFYYLAASPCSEKLCDNVNAQQTLNQSAHLESQFLNELPNKSSNTHKCCSPSIDSETNTCSDEVWGLDASDTNAGQLSDIESLPSSRLGANSCKANPGISVLKRTTLSSNDIEDVNNESLESSQSAINGAESKEPSSPQPIAGRFQRTDSKENSSQSHPLAPPSLGSNIGYFVYEYREAEEDTEESSGPVVSSTEDSDSASALSEVQFMMPVLQRQPSSVLFHRTFGRGRTNIASSDSEFETENLHRRRHARYSHHKSSHHRASDSHHHHVRPKCFGSSPRSSNPYFSQLHSNYLALGMSSPWMLSRTCNINQPDMYGRSALHYATEQGHIYIVQILIKAGVKVDTVDADHMTPLHLATQRGFTEVVNLLLDAGAKVNTKMNDKSSPLHIAASRGYTDIVESLLERGAKMDSVDSSDRTPLFLSVSRGHYKGAQLLIKRGAKVNIEEIHGYTPLCEAVWQRDLRLVQLLLHAKAKVTQSHYLLHYAVLHRHHQLVELLLGARCIVNLRDDKGDTPLLIAARSSQPNIIKLLLSNGANPNYPNGLTGARPLHEAVVGTRDVDIEQFSYILRILHDAGARLDFESITPGDTPLYRALLLGKNKASALLIRKGCNVNIAPPVAAPSDYLLMAVVRENLPLALLIVMAGFKLQSTPWLKPPYTAGSILEKLAKVRSNPSRLSDKCRIFLRHKLGQRISRCVHRLGLPTSLLGFLMLENIVGVDF